MINVNLILDFIKRNKLTKKDFCKNANISVYHLNKIISSNGKCNINAIVVVKIAIYIKMKMADLVGF